jgi:hypothetical protein
MDLALGARKWMEVGPTEYQRLRAAGKKALPGLNLLASATVLDTFT